MTIGIRRRGTLAALALALMACGSGSGTAANPRAGIAADRAPAQPAVSPAPAPREVRTSYSAVAATFAPLWAAHEFGLFEQYGLRTGEPLMINGGPANAQALVARELDASYMAFGPAGAALMAGAPIKVVAGFGQGFSHQVFTRAGSGVLGVQDMKGRRAGVSTTGSETNSVVQRWARAGGLHDDDITYINAGTGAERLAMLEGGTVDVVAITPEIAPVAMKRGYVRVADLTEERLAWQRDALTLPENMVVSDPLLATALLRAVSEAAYLIRSDRQRFDTIVSKYVKLDDPEALTAAYLASIRGWSARGRLDPANVQAVLESLQETISGAAQEPPSRFFDRTILDGLEREGFFDRLEQQYPPPAGA
jgi:NitT/TauT family transport system substrate-binding protein